MIKLLFKSLIILGITLWAINSNAVNCKKESGINHISDPLTGYFRVDALNLRAGSGKQYCIEHVLENVKGKRLLIIGRHGNWHLTSFTGKNLWVHKSLISNKPFLPSINLDLI